MTGLAWVTKVTGVTGFGRFALCKRFDICNSVPQVKRLYFIIFFDDYRILGGKNTLATQ